MVWSSLSSWTFFQKNFRENPLVHLLTIHTWALLKDHCSLLMTFGDFSLKSVLENVFLAFHLSKDLYILLILCSLFCVSQYISWQREARNYRQYFCQSFSWRVWNMILSKNCISVFYTGKSHQIRVSKLIAENLDDVRDFHSTFIHS